MEEFLPNVKLNVEKNKLAEKHLAYLIDRIEMLNGRPQIYGTQSTFNDKNEEVLYSMKDIANVNTRRKYIGLRDLKITAK